MLSGPVIQVSSQKEILLNSILKVLNIIIEKDFLSLKSFQDDVSMAMLPWRCFLGDVSISLVYLSAVKGSSFSLFSAILHLLRIYIIRCITLCLMLLELFVWMVLCEIQQIHNA